MSFERPKYRTGDIILYPYRWSWEKEEDPNSMGKYRPSLVLFAGQEGSDKDGEVAICGITSTHVYAPNNFLIISDQEIQRANLYAKTSKVVVSDVNLDSLDNEGTMRGRVLRGSFTPSFFKKIRQEVAKNFHAKTCNIVEREMVIERQIKYDDLEM
jgi:hypothetical protein